MSFYPGQRLSTKGNRCTVRYVGRVQGKPDIWLGIEWDDPTRGKHSGTHQGVEYFKCRSNHPTAGSFIRPSVVWDKPRSFVEALKTKYAATRGDTDISYDPDIEIVRISGKTAEEVGFDKIARQQSQLNNLRIVVLDDMLMKHQDDPESRDLISQTSSSITNLDLGRNLFETVPEIALICAQLDKLQSLRIDGNRLRDTCSSKDELFSDLRALGKLTTIGIDHMLLLTAELEHLLSHLPNLTELSASNNQFGSLDECRFPSRLHSVTLEDNGFTSLDDVRVLNEWCGELVTLNLKNNRIEKASKAGSKSVPRLPPSISDLDLSYNNISSWDIINDLPDVCPGLKHLRISHNPLFERLKTADGKPLTSADGYMLTIARLSKLETLNYSVITDKERLNAETYYLSQIALQISRAPATQEAEIIAQHPRWHDLCGEYGEPRIERIEDDILDPNTLAARLIKCSFYCKDLDGKDDMPNRSSPWIKELPNSLNIYTVLGMVGEHFGLQPMQIRLVVETGEKERVKAPANTWAGVQDWDSSDDEEDGEGEGWQNREVELLAGTRPLGTVIEGFEALIRVHYKASMR